MFFKLIKVLLLVSELYIYKNARYNNKKIIYILVFNHFVPIIIHCTLIHPLVYILSDKRRKHTHTETIGGLIPDIGNCCRSSEYDLLTNQTYKPICTYVKESAFHMTSFYNIHALLHVLFHWYFV